MLTASGGPFRGRERASLAGVTPAQAVAHPKWSMGPKISVDSATLMNKGLEVIEAHHLFGLPADRIDVLVHPQSLVHSLVEFIDGSTLAQLGLPDMRTALAVGLGWPRRIASGVGGLDLLAQGRLDFEAADTIAFPCLRLAFEALRAGGTAPAVLNAANEEAVSAFLQGQVGFLSIPAAGAGVWVDHFTGLDPHPVDGVGSDEFADFVLGMCGLEPGLPKRELWRRVLVNCASPVFHLHATWRRETFDRSIWVRAEYLSPPASPP